MLLYDVVGCIVHDLISHELDADFTEDEVDTVLRHLPSAKSPGWDGLTNEVFKRYSNILKGPLTFMFSKVLANRLQKPLPKLIHPAQHGFIAGRNILHNVLNVQMGMDYARNTHQELIMV